MQRRQMKEAIQIHKKQPTLNQDLEIDIPAFTLKLFSCDSMGSHDQRY